MKYFILTDVLWWFLGRLYFQLSFNVLLYLRISGFLVSKAVCQCSLCFMGFTWLQSKIPLGDNKAEDEVQHQKIPYYVECRISFFFPISVKDVLYTVCNPIGSVLRIVIFKRNGIQAMVEYPYCVSVWIFVLTYCMNVCMLECPVPSPWPASPGLSLFSVHRRPKLL